MIEKLLIQNFQSHQKKRIEFDTRITCIVGPSDVGKSAVVRALRWVCCNQPGGDSFIRTGADFACVKLFVDGHVVTRKRGKPGNSYALDGLELKAFGRGVPDPVAALLNTGPDNWQNQHDAPYWFSATAGEVSRQLNAVVDLGIIDKTLAGVATAFHRARTKLELAEEAQTAAFDMAKQTEWAVEYDAALQYVEAVADKHATTAARAADMARLVAAAVLHRQTADAARKRRAGFRAVVAVAADGIVANGRAVLLARLLATAAEAKSTMAKHTPNFAAVVAAKAAYDAVCKRGRRLASLINDAENLEDELCQKQHAAKKAAAAIPAKCPTCGRAM